MSKLLETAVMAIDEKKGEGILVYDFRSANPFIDYVILCSASNLRQVHAIADNVWDRVKEAGLSFRHMEGNKDSRWILIDLESVVVHVFFKEERQFYRLEHLYADLPRVDI